MKCKFLINADVDASTLDEKHRPLLKFRNARDHRTGKPKVEPYFPAGTEYEHPLAYHFVDIGMALPADAECEAAIQPLSPERRKRLELEYQAESLGIHDEADRELFFAGVILGYQKIEGQASLAYIPGPNYAAWKAAREEEIKAEDSTI